MSDKLDPLNLDNVSVILLHCSDTDYANQTADWIERDQILRGFSMIAYHYFIRRNGLIEMGRPLEVKGAHEQKVNRSSIGICLPWKSQPTEPAIKSLTTVLLPIIKIAFPLAVLKAHRDFDPKRTCPNVDISLWQKLWEKLPTKSILPLECA